jgi:hypothetical protein
MDVIGILGLQRKLQQQQQNSPINLAKSVCVPV